MSHSLFDKYIQKAMKYDLLANYYKYINPHLHVMYYQKHLHYIQKAIMSPHRESRQPNQETVVRIFHASPGTSSLDIYLNGRRIIRNLTYRQETDYIPLKEAGRHKFDIFPAGKTDRPLRSETFTFQEGQKHTVTAAGRPDNLDLLLFQDDENVPEGESKIRFIHLSPNTPALDVAAKGGDVIFSNVSFKEVTDYLGLTPMQVNLEVRRAGKKEVVLEIPPIRLRPNRTYTIYAVGLLGDQPALEALFVQY